MYAHVCIHIYEHTRTQKKEEKEKTQENLNYTVLFARKNP